MSLPLPFLYSCLSVSSSVSPKEARESDSTALASFILVSNLSAYIINKKYDEKRDKRVESGVST